MTIFVDDRYRGHHGIARYAREVIPRLDLEWQGLPVGGNPASVLSAFSSGWDVAKATDLVYSPGYGVGVTEARQLLTMHDLIHLCGAGMRSVARRLYYRRLVKPAIERCGHVVTVSESSAEQLRQWLGDDSTVVHNVGSGVSSSFTPEGPRFAAPRPYVLYVGNTRWHKNPEAVVETIARLDGFELLVVSPDRDAFLRLASRSQVGERVTVLDGIDDLELASLYRGAEALLFPSILEGFGLPVVESIRCGTPVVYFEGCRSVREIAGATGAAVSDPHDAQAFADGVMAVAGTSVSSANVADYEWETVAKRLERVIEAVAG
jgi:glycosyltransferase involved in cell wall biosynthesis